MTGKTLTINDIIKVPGSGGSNIITVPAQPVEDVEDLDLLTLLEKANAFINNVNRLIENAKELVNNLAINAEKLQLPPWLVEKLQLLRISHQNIANQLPKQSIDIQAILRTFEQLPDDMTVKELKELVKSVLGVDLDERERRSLGKNIDSDSKG